MPFKRIHYRTTIRTCNPEFSVVTVWVNTTKVSETPRGTEIKLTTFISGCETGDILFHDFYILLRLSDYTNNFIFVQIMFRHRNKC